MTAMSKPPNTAPDTAGAANAHPAAAELARAAELLRGQDFDRASRLIADLAGRHPAFAAVRMLEGHLALAKGDKAAARARYEAALAADANLVPALVNLGLLLFEAGEKDAALRYLRRANDLQPDDPGILGNLGLVERRHSLGRAIAAFRRALALRPDDPTLLRNLGLVLLDAGQAAEAEPCFRRLVAMRPGQAEPSLQLGRALIALERLEEAEACFADLARRQPRLPEAHLSLARLARLRGRREASLAHFRAALAVDPTNAFALARLIEAEAANPAELALARSEAGSRRRQPRDRAVLRFALYRHADRYDPAAAFRELAEANRLQHEERMRLGRTYDGAARRRFVERSEAVCDAAWLARALTLAPSDATPIFVLGMPRSGTSLCEQILSQHPRVRAFGERRELANLSNTLAAECGPAFPDCLAALDGERARAAAADYRAALGAEAGRLSVDKMPTNFQLIGLILALFPRARIVHCRRDAMDVGFSCFERNFDHAYAWAWDLGDIGHFLACHDRLMRHWRKSLPVAMLDWRYEAVVHAIEERTRELLAFCGLEWDPACLDFAASERLVDTASTEQVRRPIYTSSIGKWRRYETELAPLAAAYAGARRELGLPDDPDPA